MFSKRRNIINHVINCLKEIDGGISPYSSSYTFQTDLDSRVTRGVSHLEKINDFPTVNVLGGPERYSYQTVGCTESDLTLMIRCYLRSGDRTTLKTDCDNFIQDVDHVIYNMSTQDYNIQTAHVISIDTDQGLLEDYSIVEIQVLIRYELDLI